MSENMEFVTNYNDLSTNTGFQFEFVCNRCGTGYRTQFKETAAGMVSGVLDTASNLFGGLFHAAAEVGEKVRSSSWHKARDSALEAAIKEIKPSFIQCPRCSSWACRKACWNNKKGLCKECAPDLGVEMAAAQASRSVEEVWAHAAMAEEDKKLSEENWRENIMATCPKCEAPLPANVKFCPGCGAKVKTSDACPKCKAKLTPGAKFCPECGGKV